MKAIHIFWVGIITAFVFTSCDLTKEVDLDIPPYDNPYVIESYLQPGQPYFLVLTRGQAYFDTIRVETVEDAEVAITYGSDTIELTGLPLDLLDEATLAQLGQAGADLGALGIVGQLFGQRLYVYVNLARLVPPNYEDVFTLQVNTPDGTQLTAQTHIPRPVPIDSVEYFFDEDSMARTLTTFTDPANESNFYRRLLELRETQIDTTLDPMTNELVIDSTRGDLVIQDFFTSDENLSTPPAFGTINEFIVGDTLYSSLYSVTEDYVRFVDTRDAAFNAAFSPFGQPASLHSNVEGGSGIFLGYSISRRRVIIGQ